MLKDINLKDIYLGEKKAMLTGVPNTSDPIPAPEECNEELNELRQICIKGSLESKREEFAVRHNGTAYRVSIMDTIAEQVYVLRRFPTEVPDLSQLGIHPTYVNKLLTSGVAGLIVIAGSYGQGKTTTASSLISSRLSKLGGVAITIEDPPEMPLEGEHGEGVCYQTWVHQGGFGDATRKSARWAPSIIFLGEVRDPETAAEALRASINGCLVVCTTHADNVPMAIERIFSLANGVAGSSEDTSSLLASGLLCVMHQHLEGEPKKPKVQFLWLDDTETAGVRHMIRQRKFDQIANEVTLQLNRTFLLQRTVPQ